MRNMSSVTFGVLTISDSCFQEPLKDRSGPRLVELIKSSFNKPHVLTEILPDERDLIQREMRKWIDRKDVSIIITTGGTGFAPRDVTPEATKPLLDKDCPQLTMAIALASLQKTKFAALSRGICGIAGSTLVLNFPGSEKAVAECFETVRDLLPHALNLINNDLALVQQTHAEVQTSHRGHVCPHKTGAGNDTDRNSPFEMLQVSNALKMIFKIVQRSEYIEQLQRNILSPVNIPPFRASIKDGYAMKSTGFSGSKRVLQSIAAGDKPNLHPLQEDECFKINTGAPLPEQADCVVQIEDSKLLQRDKYGEESLVEILVEPKANLDIRSIGCDLREGEKIFPAIDSSPVVLNSLMASAGLQAKCTKPRVAIISTGSELLSPTAEAAANKIFDSNTTMLEQLLVYFGFVCTDKLVLSDDFGKIKSALSELFNRVDFIICSGGVSMGDKDYIKPVLHELKFQIHIGRVNMKPGKPFTFASRANKYFFGLPGNPVSAFVTFHMFALPALRSANGVALTKCPLAVINVKLLNDAIELDPRPEYVRASVTCKSGQLCASVNGDQISSRLQSIVGADVLIHLPGRTPDKTQAKAGEIYSAYVLRYDFISKYVD